MAADPDKMLATKTMKERRNYAAKSDITQEDGTRSEKINDVRTRDKRVYAAREYKIKTHQHGTREDRWVTTRNNVGKEKHATTRNNTQQHATTRGTTKRVYGTTKFENTKLTRTSTGQEKTVTRNNTKQRWKR